MPGGFKKISETSLGLALAVPEDWQIEPPKPVTISAVKVTSADDIGLLTVYTSPCSQLNLDAEKVRNAVTKVFGTLVFHGEPKDEPVNGRRSMVIGTTLSVPKELVSGIQPAKDVKLDLLIRQIYDAQNGRCISVMYPNNEIGRKIISTMNIQPPE